jgi:hypothetical protein
MAGWALGLLDLSAGRPAPAFDRLQELAGPALATATRWCRSGPPPTWSRRRSAGRPEAAPGALALLEGWAAATGAPWGSALAARCRGLLAGGEEAEARFAEALDLNAAGARPRDPRP